MSRPSRHSSKSQSHHYSAETNGPNGTEASATSALSKARARLNEPVVQLQNIFPDWKEEDLISVLEEARGDVEIAVTRISEGHAEQWGSVKHKKDKKTSSQRERDGLNHHPNLRGGTSPRGRGRGGRGAGPHSSSSRQNRERNTNGVTSMSSSAPKGDSTSHSEDVNQQQAIESQLGDDNRSGVDADISGTPYIAPTTITRLGSGSTSRALPEVALESSKPPSSSAEDKDIQNHTSGLARKTPASSGLSWAQIAKPQAQAVIHPQPSLGTSDLPSISADKVVEAEPTPVREAPTTVETPIWDDEPPQQNPLVQDIISQKSEDGWVDVSVPLEPHSKTDTAPVSVPEKSTTEIAPVIPSTPPASHIESSAQDSHVDLIQHPIQNINPPPGLASPSTSTITSNKPPISSGVRPSIGVHRPSSRYKTDKAVNLPPQTQAASLAFGYGKPLAVQFGSLDITIDEPETQIEPQVTSKAQEDVSTTSATEVAQTSHSTASPNAGYGNPPPQQPQELTEAVSALGGPVHTQAPSVNPSLAVAPAPGTSFPHQLQPSLPSQHTLAGLTHTPTSHAPTHAQQASFGQQGSFPQQYDNPGLNVTGNLLSNPNQLSQTQTQGFFRQTDSPFFNQTQGPNQETHFGGVGSGGGGYSQGIPSNFNSGPGLNTEFGYDTQRPIPYETYNPPLSTRSMLRQEDLKGLGSNAPTLGVSHTHNQSNQIGNSQSTGAQGQSQYPGMAHMTNPYYYNVNIPPYGYGNQFYSPAFTSFVNPMFQGGTQTPPHGSKPSHIVTPSGIGVHGGSSFGSGTNNNHHHSNSTFDGEPTQNTGSTYHQAASVTPADFGKSVYSGGQSFLGNMSTPSVSGNRSVGGGSVGTPVNLPAGAIQDPTLKGYGGSVVPSNMGISDKAGPSQVPGRGTNLSQNQQQFYQGSRFPNISQNQGYPSQQQQQTDNFYPTYQRW